LNKIVTNYNNTPVDVKSLTAAEIKAFNQLTAKDIQGEVDNPKFKAFAEYRAKLSKDPTLPISDLFKYSSS
jgi:hypothetical protein